MPAKGGFDSGVCQLSRRFVALRHGVEIARILFYRPGGVIVEIGGNGIELPVQRYESLLCILNVAARSIESRLRSHMGGQ
jgi:hypothetical protein